MSASLPAGLLPSTILLVYAMAGALSGNLDSKTSYHAAAAVDRSMTSGCPAVGTPTAIGFVPKMGSVLPCGATYSGDWLMAMPIRPC